MQKKILTIILALLFVTTAEAILSLPESAASLIPETAALLEQDFEDGAWEYEYRDGDMRYELLIRDDQPVALTIRNAALRPSPENTLTKEAAVSSVPGEILFAQAEKDDGRWTWKIIARVDNDLYEYDLHAETGEVIEAERYFNASLSLPEGTYKFLDLEWDDGKLRFERDD